MYLKPLNNMPKDSNKIRTDATLFSMILFLPFTTLNNIPTPNIKGIVPKQNKNIDKAPFINELVDKA